MIIGDCHQLSWVSVHSFPMKMAQLKIWTGFRGMPLQGAAETKSLSKSIAQHSISGNSEQILSWILPDKEKWCIISCFGYMILKKRI